MLVARDSAAARLTVLSLYQAALAGREEQAAAANTPAALQHCFAMGAKHAALVGCLQGLALCHHGLGIEAEAAAKAAHLSGCLQGGALQVLFTVMQPYGLFAGMCCWQIVCQPSSCLAEWAGSCQQQGVATGL